MSSKAAIIDDEPWSELLQPRGPALAANRRWSASGEHRMGAAETHAALGPIRTSLMIPIVILWGITRETPRQCVLAWRGADRNEVRGLAASSGSANGTRRIVKSAKSFRVASRQISRLPRHYPTWTPIFQKIGRRGPTSAVHEYAAIVAPRVRLLPSWTGNATSKIKTAAIPSTADRASSSVALNRVSNRPGEIQSAGFRNRSCPPSQGRRQRRSLGELQSRLHLTWRPVVHRAHRGLRGLSSNALERCSRFGRASMTPADELDGWGPCRASCARASKISPCGRVSARDPRFAESVSSYVDLQDEWRHRPPRGDIAEMNRREDLRRLDGACT